MNKSKLINLLLVLASLFGYLEWGKGASTFLFEAEWDILHHFIEAPKSLAHPFVLIPLIGQVLLLATLFQKRPSPLISYMGIGCIGILLAFMLFIGILGGNAKIARSTLPFFSLAVVRIVYRKRIAEA